jgi:hypothetical protein
MRQHADSLIFFFSSFCASLELVCGDRLGDGHVQDPIEDFEVAVAMSCPTSPASFVTTAQTDPYP